MISRMLRNAELMTGRYVVHTYSGRDSAGAVLCRVCPPHVDHAGELERVWWCLPGLRRHPRYDDAFPLYEGRVLYQADYEED